MSKVGNFRVRCALLCEDIREEINNKMTIVGVCNGAKVVSHLPAQIPVAFYVEALLKKPGKTEITFRISSPGDAQTTFNLQFTTQSKNEAVWFPIRNPALSIEGTGTLLLEASADKEKWVTLVEKAVIQNNDQQQPQASFRLPPSAQ